MYLKKKEIRNFLDKAGWGVYELKEILDIEYSEAVRMIKGERVKVDTVIKFIKQVYMSRIGKYLDWGLIGISNKDEQFEILKALEILEGAIDE